MAQSVLKTVIARYKSVKTQLGQKPYKFHDINAPKDKGITSIGTGCQDMLIDRCQFLSNESQVPATQRVSVAFNVNANDTKIRDSRFVRFGTTMILHGTGHLIVGNHWFQGDEETNGARIAGLVFTQTNVQSAVTGNYIDNSVIEWTNEYDPTPAFGNEYSFGGLTVTGNTFVSLDAAPWFTWFSIKPYGAGHFIQGLNISCNVFRAINGDVDRFEKVDTTYADLDRSRFRNIQIEANTFNGVGQFVCNPVFLQVDQATAQTVWTITPGAYLPFGGWARNVESVLAEGMITNLVGSRVSSMPYVVVEQGSGKQDVTLNWAESAKGRVQVKIRCDNPN